MRDIILIVHNLRSSHNVGSLLRTADGLGVSHIYLTGYTPYPQSTHDARLPHLAQKIHGQISKTALGAELANNITHEADITVILDILRQDKYAIAALEQAPYAAKLHEFVPPEKSAIILGREVEGLEPEILALADNIIEIPMFGKKESFNVVQAAAMALYHFRFT